MTIGGVSVPKQAVELAQKMSAQFSSGEGSDGLLGLAWPDINTVSPQPVKTPVQNMIEQGLIAQPLFTVKLDRGDNAGFYSFGEVRSLCYAAFFALMFIPGQIDETVTSNPITYTPVDKYIRLSIMRCGSDRSTQLTGLLDGPLHVVHTQRQDDRAPRQYRDPRHRQYVCSSFHTCSMLIQFRHIATLALIDDATVSKIYGAIKGAKFDSNQGGWMYPATAKVPSVAFAIGDTMYTVRALAFLSFVDWRLHHS